MIKTPQSGRFHGGETIFAKTGDRAQTQENVATRSQKIMLTYRVVDEIDVGEFSRFAPTRVYWVGEDRPLLCAATRRAKFPNWVYDYENGRRKYVPFSDTDVEVFAQEPPEVLPRESRPSKAVIRRALFTRRPTVVPRPIWTRQDAPRNGTKPRSLKAVTQRPPRIGRQQIPKRPASPRANTVVAVLPETLGQAIANSCTKTLHTELKERDVLVRENENLGMEFAKLREEVIPLQPFDSKAPRSGNDGTSGPGGDGLARPGPSKVAIQRPPRNEQQPQSIMSSCLKSDTLLVITYETAKKVIAEASAKILSKVLIERDVLKAKNEKLRGEIAKLREERNRYGLR